MAAMHTVGVHSARSATGLDLSVRGFARGIMFGVGTQRTPRFDDYTKGGYHVDSVELLKVVPAEATL
jgi:hypothetical protein